jgi:HD-GYP domain-containing protein (c-di-GMP phosphodiesterase class II)
VNRVEIAALLALAQDHAFGQPLGSQLRATVLGQHLAEAAGAGADERATTWWTSALRFLGCTGHSFEVAVVFGDEIELRAESLRADAANPLEFLRLSLTHAGPGQHGLGRLRSVLAILAGGRKGAEMNFRTACEVADVFAGRLGLDEPVRTALATNFERWNGRGLPKGVKGEAIPRSMRMAQLSQEFEVLARIEGVEQAIYIIKDRKGKAYEPGLADLTIAHAVEWWDAVEPVDSWDAALAVAPPSAPLSAEERRDVLLVLADFADLKSPWTGGHSRAVAELAREACGEEAEAAALVHDIGRIGVANTVWDKPSRLTRDERDRAEVHALLTDQLLRRVPELSRLATTACSAHERVDGSGYHRRVTSGQLDPAQRVIAAADCYQAMTSDRPHRLAMTADAAAAELRKMAAAGELDGEAVERVLAAAGHRRTARPRLPAGLTPREVDVLRLLALGLTARQVADRLSIAAKTVDHHVQHIYTKLGVSTRGAAALFAIENGILPAA